MTAPAFLLHLLQTHLDGERGLPWLTEQREKLSAGHFAPRSFYLAFSACPRYIPRTAPAFAQKDLEEAERHYPNFGATDWTLDQLARIYLATQLPTERNVAILDDLFATADYHELIAGYRSLYWLPNPEAFVARAREGSRTNMTGVFDALALENPYPAEYLPDDAWNQLVLKAMFMQRPMYRIYRIEDRKNPALASMFLDYAEERRSAHRSVSPELWRFVAGFVAERAGAALETVVATGTSLERDAARLALSPTGGTPKDWNEIGRRAEAE